MEDLIFDSNGEVDVEAMIDVRDTRNIPPNPPPEAVGKNRIDGKALANIAVSLLIDSGSWKHAAVMSLYIDCANRTERPIRSNHGEGSWVQHKHGKESQ
jgi:hypothetical protein